MDMDIEIEIDKDIETWNAVQRKARSENEWRNIWGKKTPTPSFSSLSSSWASPSYSFASPWSPFVIGRGPMCSCHCRCQYLCTLGGSAVWESNWGRFRIWNQFGAQILDNSQCGPNWGHPVPLSVLCLKILRLCRQGYVCLCVTGYFCCSTLQPLCTKETLWNHIVGSKSPHYFMFRL